MLKRQVLIAGHNVFSNIVFPYLDMGVGVGVEGLQLKSVFLFLS